MTINKEYKLAFKNETLYNAWISPKMIVPPITKMYCEPVKGGKLILYSKPSFGISVMQGRFIEVISNKKLVYTWAWEDSGEETLVTVKFNEASEGCKILLEHAWFQTKESKEMHDSGWDNYIKGLLEILMKRVD